MPKGPQNRTAEDGKGPAVPESIPPETIPEEVAESGRKRNATDTEWLSMATADPAYFLNDLPSD